MGRRFPHRTPEVIHADLARKGLLAHIERVIADEEGPGADILAILGTGSIHRATRQAIWHALYTLPPSVGKPLTFAKIGRLCGGPDNSIREGVFRHCERKGIQPPGTPAGVSRTRDPLVDPETVASSPAAMRPGRLRMVRDDHQRRATCSRYGNCLDTFVREHKGKAGFCPPTCSGFMAFAFKATSFLTQRDTGTMPSGMTRGPSPT